MSCGMEPDKHALNIADNGALAVAYETRLTGRHLCGTDKPEAAGHILAQCLRRKRGRKTTGSATQGGAESQGQKREKLASEPVFLDPPDFDFLRRPDHRRMEAVLARTLFMRRTLSKNR